MLLLHAKEILDRGLSAIWAHWHLDEHVTESGLLLALTEVPDGYSLCIEGLSNGASPLVVPFSTLQADEIHIPHVENPLIASPLQLALPHDNPVDLLRQHNIDLEAISLLAANRARSPSATYEVI